MAAKMTHGASFSSASSSRGWKYDVFLSFCGMDTRKNFTDHLYTALDRDGIHTFRDNDEIERGKEIHQELMDAIEGSRIAIIVFSENYADSTWCLDELVKTLGCKEHGQMEKVLPVFYKLDPSVVRKQSNTYAKAFEKHEERFKEEMGKVENWKAALTEVANLSGWDQFNVADGHEAKLIKTIVEEVWAIVTKTPLDVAAYPIGLKSHIESIRRLLNDQSDVVRFIGIHGCGGIGKTTIAKAIFNIIFQNFEGSSFLANVRENSRENSSRQNGLALLQEQLLSSVLKKNDIKIHYEDQGISMIKKHLRCKRVLIVLDDVDELDQLNKLAREHDWFGPRSRIIITTRDEHLLNRPEVDEKYKMETMNQNESLQLFSWHAFRHNHPLEGYVELSNNVVHYAGGLPLALVTLGSLLVDKSSQDEWESELEKLRKIPNGKIQQILEISYVALEEFQKIIFLDISCFFVGEDKDEVIPFLDACGLLPKHGIRVLIERSLVTIDELNKLGMHDLIQDMGREIVRKQSSLKPGKRSRLWDRDDVVGVLENCTGTDEVEGLRVKMLEQYKLQLTTEAFFKMPNLRLLQIECELFSGKLVKLEHSIEERASCFRNLVWVRWPEFPLKYIPNNFDLRNLAILEMPYNNLKEVWKGNKPLPKLKVLNLSYSRDLTCTPDFSGAPNLEKLNLMHCTNLVEVHESIEHLSKLVVLNLVHCNKLRILPSGISKLASLEELDITECYSLENIQELPSSSGLWKNLTTFRYFGGRVIDYYIKSAAQLTAPLFGLSTLKYLFLPSCHLTNDDIPDDLGKLCSLKELDLSQNDFLSLPSSICQLSKLETLKLESCRFLQSLPMLPSSLRYLDASCCFSLERLSNLSNLKHLRKLQLSSCSKLTEIDGLDCLESVESIQLNWCYTLKSFLKERMLQEISKNFHRSPNVCDIIYSGNEVPEWFEYQSEESSSASVSCQVTQLHNMEIQGLIICFVFWESKYVFDYLQVHVVVHNQSKPKNVIWEHKNIIYLDHISGMTIWVMKIPKHCIWKSIAEHDDTINVSVEISRYQSLTSRYEPGDVKKIGVHLCYTSHAKISEFADMGRVEKQEKAEEAKGTVGGGEAAEAPGDEDTKALCFEINC